MRVAAVQVNLSLKETRMTRSNNLRCAVSLAAFLLASGGAFAANNVPHADEAFMKKAAEAGMAEIEASKMAAEKASNTQVKSFAQQMVDDHTKAADELKQLAESKGVKLPTEPSMMQKAKLKMLKSDTGVAFDKRYADSFGVSAHKDTVSLFQKEATKGKDAETKAWAEKTLPALQHHMEMANDLKKTTDAEKK